MSKEVVENSDTILAGSIPINEDLSGNGIIGDERTFSCNYGFQQDLHHLFGLLVLIHHTILVI